MKSASLIIEALILQSEERDTGIGPLKRPTLPVAGTCNQTNLFCILRFGHRQNRPRLPALSA